MDYEVHLTTKKKPTLEIVKEFSEITRSAIHGKTLLIELSSGDFPLQLMASFRLVGKFESDAISRAESIASLFNSDLEIGRIKVETTLSAGANIKYYEGHWKFNVSDASSLKNLAPEWHYSHSFFDPSIHWLTKRYPPNAEKIQEKFELDLEQIDKVVPVHTYHFEAVVEDTNPDMDKGWF